MYPEEASGGGFVGQTIIRGFRFGLLRQTGRKPLILMREYVF
jgi:hypothetical protein